MHYITNGSRYVRFTDEDTCEVWDDELGWTFPIPSEIAIFGPDWHRCDDPELVTYDELVEQSSLGTPGAKALRARVSDEEAARVRERADEPAPEVAASLTVWTIFFDPTDYPGKWVLRGFDARAGAVDAHEECVVADSLETVRAALPPGVARIARESWDDPAIYESWV